MKRTRRYSKNEKKKFNTEKKERDAFAPAPSHQRKQSPPLKPKKMKNTK